MQSGGDFEFCCLRTLRLRPPTGSGILAALFLQDSQDYAGLLGVVEASAFYNVKIFITDPSIFVYPRLYILRESLLEIYKTEVDNERQTAAEDP